jgi:hypothetical protein
MKRYLNKLRTFTVLLVSGKEHRYQLSSGTLDENELFIGPDENELFIGEIGATEKILFIYRSEQIYNLSYDDFSYDFLNEENTRLNTAFDDLSFPSTTAPTISIEDGEL